MNINELYQRTLDRLGENDVSFEFNRPYIQSILTEMGNKYVSNLKGEKIESIRDELRSIKERSVNNIENLIKLAKDTLEDHNCSVIIAEDANKANKYISDVVGEGRLVARSKSNTIKEIGLDEYLEDKGIAVIHTDLGDRVMQLAEKYNWRPGHPVVPAIHMPIKEIAKVLTKEYGRPVRPDINDIFLSVKKDLWKRTLAADVGITGANAISAGEGMIGIMTNEGNDREVSTIPKKYIAVAGLEKIVFNLKDAVSICYGSSKLLFGTTPNYISFISGPSWSTDLQGSTSWGIHGPEEMHVILLDNGRMKAKLDGFEEILYCINCGSCMMYCPVYYQLLWKFGNMRSCGIGVLYSVYTQDMPAAIINGLDYCTGCGKCFEFCPVRLDIPSLIEKMRNKANSMGFLIPPWRKIIENVEKYGNPFGEQKEKRSDWMFDKK